MNRPPRAPGLMGRLADRFAIEPMLARARQLRASGALADAADAYDVAGDALEEVGDHSAAATAHRQAWGLRTHGEEWQTVRMVFRVWRGEVIALMPELPYNERSLRPLARARYGQNTVTSYMHMGQHGGADYRVIIARSRPARAEEYEPLLLELTRLGYDVVPIERLPRTRR